jgi:hypothetical protein
MRELSIQHGLVCSTFFVLGSQKSILALRKWKTFFHTKIPEYKVYSVAPLEWIIFWRFDYVSLSYAKSSNNPSQSPRVNPTKNMA